MGVVVSTTSETSPFFLTTGIIGLVSFAFTVSTFLKVVWTNIDTLCEAEHEVHAYLTNLRTELLEERNSLRMMRKTCRHHKHSNNGSSHDRRKGIELDEITLKVMADTIRHLIQRFKAIERPFLGPGELGIQEDLKHHGRTASRNRPDAQREASRKRRRSSVEKYYNQEAGNRGHRGYVYARDGDSEHDDDDAFWPQRTDYGKYGLGKRLKWLYKKPEAQRLVQALERMQIRRIAQQTSALAIAWREQGGAMLDIEDMVRRIDDRMSRFVGVRRIGGESGAG